MHVSRMSPRMRSVRQRITPGRALTFLLLEISPVHPRRLMRNSLMWSTEISFVAGEYDAPCDDHLELWIGFLLDVRTPAREADSISIGPGNPPKGMKLAVTTAAMTSPTSPGTSTSPRGKGDIRNRWEGPGPGWMRGEVYLVNPSQVVSTEGLQRYPKGTFGIRWKRKRRHRYRIYCK